MPTQTPKVDTSEPLLDRAQEFVPKSWDQIKVAYTTYRQGVWEARLRYVNQQWLDWDNDKRMFSKSIPQDKFVPMPNINRFAPWIDGIASNFASVPEIEAIPVPLDDPISMGIADVANNLCDHAIKDNALRSDYGSREDRSNIARQLFTLGGCVFSRVRLEDKVIGQNPVMAAGEVTGGIPSQQQDENGQPMMEPVTSPRVIVDIEDPVWFSPRPGATSMDNTTWLFCARRMSIDAVKERTGLDAEADGEYPDGFNTSYQNELTYWYLGYAAPQNATMDSCLFVEFWCEPNKKEDFPEGCYAVYFNGKVQSAIPWSEIGPVDHPVTKGDMQMIPGIFFPRASSFDLCEIQKQLSTLDSAIELHLKTSAVEPIVIDENSKVSEITGRADKVIYWRSIGPGSKEPHRMAHGNLDPKLYERVLYLEEKGDRIAAVTAAWRGDAPGEGVTASSAIAQLRGQAEMQFATPVKAWNNFWKETIRKCVMFYQKYELAELAQIVGKDKVSKINDFQNCDLNKCVEFMATSNGLPRTRDERRQEMMMLFDKGALDTKDPTVQQKLFDLFGDTGMMENFNEDSTRCRSNIRAIKDGKPTTPTSPFPPQFRPGIDDPEVHHSIATSAAKSMDFDQWPPQSQQMLLGYIQSVAQQLAAQVPPDPNIAKAQMDQQTKAAQGSLEKQMADDKNRTALDIAVINATVKEQVDNLTLQQDQIKHFIDALMDLQQQQIAASQPPPQQAAGQPTA